MLFQLVLIYGAFRKTNSRLHLRLDFEAVAPRLFGAV